MCNACGFLCCASDCFEGCGCDHCGCSSCWTEDDDFDDSGDDYIFDEENAIITRDNSGKVETNGTSNE